MDAKTLIDGIIRQTTVLIAQVSTSAGLRAPLAHVADQLFVELALEIERQGVGRKVVADMFGLALRGYQKKVSRLTQSVTERERTLWEAVLSWLTDQKTASRAEVLFHFSRDPPEDVAAVLKDLVESGLAFSSGRGHSALFGVTSEADRRRIVSRQKEESTEQWIAFEVAQKPRTGAELAVDLHLEIDDVDRAIDQLRRDGRIRTKENNLPLVFETESYSIPVGAKLGWETAVYDHLKAVTQAVVAKLVRSPESAVEDVIGGATWRFDVDSSHPLRKEVLALLKNIRTEVNDLWNRVEAYNSRSSTSIAQRDAVYFYFGQNFVPAEPFDEAYEADLS